MSKYFSVFLVLTGSVLATAWGADPRPGRRADQEALKAYGGLVGSWRGVGQPQRQSPKGAWVEKASWAWKLTSESAALEITIEGGKYLQSARLRPDGEAGRFALEAVLTDGTRRTFLGRAGERDTLVLAAEGADLEGLRRIKLSPLHDTRFLLLLEGRSPGGERLQRLGEVGYTRQGVAFAAGESYPLCIVTDGRGETVVTFEGRTYYVCCSGCRDLFQDDPAGVIAEAEARRKGK